MVREAGLARLLQGPVQSLFRLFEEGDEKLWIVGGAVRNALLDLPDSDIDCATTARPEEVLRRAAAAGLRAVPTGIDHGTVTLVVEGHGFEVTTLREDVATDGRHAEVRFGRALLPDAERRDFTINALYLDAKGTLCDPLGGLADLLAKRVRFIGDATRRIREDYLRILRFFRFFATYAEGPPDEAGLARLSRERIRLEMLKMMTAPRAVEAVSHMSDTGILQRVLGGVAYIERFSALRKDICASRNCEHNAALNLAALAIATAEDGERIAEHLRLTNEEARLCTVMADIDQFIRRHRFQPDRHALRRLRYRWGDDGRALAGAQLLAAGAREAHALLRDDDAWRPPLNPFTGRKLLEHGVEPGPRLGAILAALEEAWIAADFPTDTARQNAMILEALSKIPKA